MSTPKIKDRIKRKMSAEKPTIWVGRNGVTDQLVKEVLKQLDKNDIVKMKILKSAVKSENAENVIHRLVQKTDSTLIDQRGHILVLYRPRKRKKPLYGAQ